MPDKSVILKALKEDSLELIQKLNSGLLIVEKDPNQKETWEDIMRSLHNLKGLARVMGFEDIGTLSHRMEDIVKLITEKKVPFSPQMVDTLLRGVDSIDYLLKAAIDDHEVDFNLPQMLSQLEAAARGEQVKVKTDKKDTKKEVGEEKPSVTATPQASGIQESIRVRTEKLDYLLNLSSEMIIDRICLNKEIKDMENIQDMLYREIQEWQRFSREWRAFNRTMDKTKINDFNEWFGRNIQNSLSIKEKFDNLFYTHSQTISHHSMSVTDLQHRITEIRMLPISILISTFPRMVRDLSHQFKKEIDLVMEGSEIEVDKKILEELRDPLIHILRNSIDHGIEEPAERTKKGKSALGNIKISVKYQGNRLRIEFSDNGRGIDIEKIKKKAVKKGLYKEKDIESLEREDLLNLIFKPGFSTSEIVTSLSGR